MSSRKSTTRRGLILVAALLTVLVAGGAIYSLKHFRLNQPVVYTDPAEHFKYGSIGGDVQNGLPLEIMKVLPRAFPEYVPHARVRDYTAFGFIQEPGHPMPIGFSVRQHLVPRTGLNCAACHVGSVRVAETDPSPIFLGMPALNMDLQAFFQFLFDCAGDDRFTGSYLIPLMQQNGAKLNALDRLVYARLIIPGMKKTLLVNQKKFTPLFYSGTPAFGPGRVDTFNPYKVNQLAEHYAEGMAPEEAIGIADYPSLWNQQARAGMALNWDGNAPRVKDRDMGAAFGAGATRESIDVPAIHLVSDFLQTLPPPAYPFDVTRDTAVLGRGERLYSQHCALCHAIGGGKTGKVEPLDNIGTDPHRLQSYTAKLNQLLIDYGEGYAWKLTEMAKTDGYANKPLDAVWGTAPYLHNGSVPTLWDLLTPEDKRNGGQPTFYTGHGLYDTVNVGMRTDVAELAGRKSFLFDVRLPGNSNRGHTGVYYGTALTDSEKRDLIEYMKTLH